MATTPDRAARALAPRPAPPPTTTTATSVREVVDAQHGYGGLVTRFIAAGIDALVIDLLALVVAGVVALVLSIFPITHDTRTLLAVIGGALFTIWVVGYFVTFWTTTGQTPGDRVMCIRVVREDGGKLKPRHAVLRLVAAVVGLILLLGYVPILLNDRRRALHDWVAGTVVINQPDPTRGVAR